MIENIYSHLYVCQAFVGKQQGLMELPYGPWEVEPRFDV